MSRLGGVDWYGGWDTSGYMSPNQASPQMMPGGMFMDQWGLFGGNPVGIQGLAMGQHQPSPFMGLANMMGQFMFGQGFTPSGGFYSPVARNMFENQMHQQAALQAHARTLDQGQFQSMFQRLDSSLTGTPGSIEAAENYSNMLVSTLYHPAYQQAFAQTPAGRSFDRMIGGTAAGASMAMFQHTRHLDIPVSEINSITRQLVDQHRFTSGPRAGLQDMAVTQGLSLTEQGSLIGVLAQNNLLDMSALASGEDFGGHKEIIQKYARVTAGLKDIFGPDAPIEQLIQNLNQLTQGGMSQMNESDLMNIVDRMKVTSLSTVADMRTIQLGMQQSGVAARQMGLPGAVGASVFLDSMQMTHAITGSRGTGPVWGRESDAEITNALIQGSLNLAQTTEGSAMLGFLRGAEALSGVEMSGEQERLRQRFMGIADDIRSGRADINDFRNVGALSQEFASLFGGAGQARSFLSDITMNSEFLQRNPHVFLQAERTLARDNITDILRTYDLSPDQSEAVLEAILSSTDRNEIAQNVAEVMGTNQFEGGNLHQRLLTDLRRMGYGDTSIDILRGGIDGSLEDMRRKTEIEQFLTGTGVGRPGGVMNRFMTAFTSGEEMTVVDALGALFGGGTRSQRDQIETMMQESGFTEQIEGLLPEINRLSEKIAAGDHTEDTAAQLADLEVQLESIIDNTPKAALLRMGRQASQMADLLGGVAHGSDPAQSAQLLRKFLSTADGVALIKAKHKAGILDGRLEGVEGLEGLSPEELIEKIQEELSDIEGQGSGDGRRKAREKFIDKFGTVLAGVFEEDEQGRTRLAEDFMSGLGLESLADVGSNIADALKNVLVNLKTIHTNEIIVKNEAEGAEGIA